MLEPSQQVLASELVISSGPGAWSVLRTPSKNLDFYTITTYILTVPGSRGERDDAVPNTLPHDGFWTDTFQYGGDEKHD
jgi:hypothetical protein